MMQMFITEGDQQWKALIWTCNPTLLLEFWDVFFFFLFSC